MQMGHDGQRREKVNALVYRRIQHHTQHLPPKIQPNLTQSLMRAVFSFRSQLLRLALARLLHDFRVRLDLTFSVSKIVVHENLKTLSQDLEPSRFRLVQSALLAQRSDSEYLSDSFFLLSAAV